MFFVFGPSCINLTVTISPKRCPPSCFDAFLCSLTSYSSTVQVLYGTFPTGSYCSLIGPGVGGTCWTFLLHSFEFGCFCGYMKKLREEISIARRHPIQYDENLYHILYSKRPVEETSGRWYRSNFLEENGRKGIWGRLIILQDQRVTGKTCGWEVRMYSTYGMNIKFIDSPSFCSGGGDPEITRFETNCRTVLVELKLRIFESNRREAKQAQW